MVTLSEIYGEIVEKWFGGRDERPFIANAIREIEKNWDRNIFVIEAPTGYGKSTISATIAAYSLQEELKSTIAFPLRTLLEDQYNKFKGLFGNKLGKRYMHNPDSPYLIKPVTLTTIDTLALTLFGIPPEDLDKAVKYWDGTSSGSLGHYLFSQASVALSNIVLDEVHLLADSTKSLNFLFALMHAAIDNDQKLVLMSATIPEALKKRIKEFNPDVCMVEFNESFDRKFVEERRKKKYRINLIALASVEKFGSLERILLEGSKKFSKITVVFNTIGDAVYFYNNIKEKIPEFKKLLLHSRFSEMDREKKAELLAEMKKSEKFVIVTTQVIEAGVDISSNLFITEIAPASSLIQRLGRFLRYGEREGEVYIWYEVDDRGELARWKDDRYKVYDYSLTALTLEKLAEMKNFSVHVDYDRLLDVYGEFEVDERGVNDLRRILMNFENINSAVEKFFELEGSFVRDSFIIPVVPYSVIEEKRRSSKVPVSFETFKNFKVYGCIVSDEFVSAEKLKCNLSSPKALLRDMIRKSIAAFVVDGDYDSEMGLVKR
ncbi:MAG: hypothetical protein XD40_1903 [Archaeoglobus fulgidus]|uniref:Helicase ATP-binding domain-containing protein n=1 Tax=Archaeoglobus fulgidus TaxID=2234 RepID=A0A101DCA4_ARCFL|nr:CRISPR-associated helicase Cas3' [Archaeoglobus fulgidus]KUJ92897.1 MAG: hypothetical protein XD40_1903 [Archaeoglobus fulgidus]KUK06337.1 MAG: hypothetical protein XD48_1434 [Archaeoglobus fulgidus]